MRSGGEIVQEYWEDTKGATVFQALILELVADIRDVLVSLKDQDDKGGGC